MKQLQFVQPTKFTQKNEALKFAKFLSTLFSERIYFYYENREYIVSNKIPKQIKESRLYESFQKGKQSL